MASQARRNLTCISALIFLAAALPRFGLATENPKEPPPGNCLVSAYKILVTKASKLLNKDSEKYVLAQQALGVRFSHKQIKAVKQALNLKPPEERWISEIDAGRQDRLLLNSGLRPEQILTLRMDGFLGQLEPAKGSVPIEGLSLRTLPLGKFDGRIINKMMVAGRKLEELRRQQRVAQKKGNQKKLDLLAPQIEDLEKQLEIRYFSGREGIKVADRETLIPGADDLWVVRDPKGESFVVTEAGVIRYDPSLKQFFFLKEYGNPISSDDFALIAQKLNKEYPGIKIRRDAKTEMKNDEAATRSIECIQSIHRNMHGYGMLRDTLITQNVVDFGVRIVIESSKDEGSHFWNTPQGISTFVLDTAYAQLKATTDGYIRKKTAISDLSPASALLWRFMVKQGVKSSVQDPIYTYGLRYIPPLFAPAYGENPEELRRQIEKANESRKKDSRPLKAVSPQQLADYLIYGGAKDPFTRSQNAYNEKFLVGGITWGYIFDKAVLNQLIPAMYNACLAGKLTRILFNPTSLRLVSGAAQTSLYFGLRPTPKKGNSTLPSIVNTQPQDPIIQGAGITPDLPMVEPRYPLNRLEWSKSSKYIFASIQQWFHINNNYELMRVTSADHEQLTCIQKQIDYNEKLISEDPEIKNVVGHLPYKFGAHVVRLSDNRVGYTPPPRPPQPYEERPFEEIYMTPSADTRSFTDGEINPDLKIELSTQPVLKKGESGSECVLASRETILKAFEKMADRQAKK